MKTIWEKKYTMPEWGKLYKEYEKMCFSGKYAYKIDLSRLGITTPNDIEQVEIVFRENKMCTHIMMAVLAPFSGINMEKKEKKKWQLLNGIWMEEQALQ